MVAAASSCGRHRRARGRAIRDPLHLSPQGYGESLETEINGEASRSC